MPEDPITDEQIKWLARQGGGMLLIYVPPQKKRTFGGCDITQAEVSWFHFDEKIDDSIEASQEYLSDCAFDMVRTIFKHGGKRASHKEIQ